MMTQTLPVELKSLKNGEYFKRKPEAITVFIKGDYVRDQGLNKYSCIDTEDINREIFLKGSTPVYVDFEY